MSEKTQKKLLSGARQCLLEKGFRQTTIKAIARFSGVNHGLVHHYFGNKEELFVALVDIVLKKEINPESIFEQEGFPLMTDASNLNLDELQLLVKNKIAPILTSDLSKLIMELLIMSEEMPKVKEQMQLLLKQRRKYFGQIFHTDDPGLHLLISGALMGIMFQYKLDNEVEVENAVFQLFSFIVKK